MLTPENRLKQLKAYFINQRYVQAAYILGKAVQGNGGQVSNAEVAVLLNGEVELWHEQKLKLAEGLAWIFNANTVDVIVLNSAEPVTAHRALYEGELIFVRDDNSRARHEKRILRSFLDTSFLRKRHEFKGEYIG